MRIIKIEDLKSFSSAIAPMIFEELDEFGPTGGNGGDSGNAVLTEMELEKARREAEKLRVDAANEADKIKLAAGQEAERIRAQAEKEAEKLRQEAAAAAEIGKKEGYASGYSSGVEDGYKKGYEDGYGKGKNAAIDETRATINMMGEVVEQLKSYHSKILEESQGDIARMAISVARKVLHKEIMTDPMTVVSVVQAALEKIAFKKHFVINVNPLDLEIIQKSGDKVKSMLQNAQSIQFKASPQVEAGGCVVQTESGMVDSQVSRKVSEVEAAVMKAMGE